MMKKFSDSNLLLEHVNARLPVWSLARNSGDVGPVEEIDNIHHCNGLEEMKSLISTSIRWLRKVSKKISLRGGGTFYMEGFFNNSPETCLEEQSEQTIQTWFCQTRPRNKKFTRQIATQQLRTFAVLAGDICGILKSRSRLAT